LSHERGSFKPISVCVVLRVRLSKQACIMNCSRWASSPRARDVTTWE
jgi:hypothetical protein